MQEEEINRKYTRTRTRTCTHACTRTHSGVRIVFERVEIQADAADTTSGAALWRWKNAACSEYQEASRKRQI